LPRSGGLCYLENHEAEGMAAKRVVIEKGKIAVKVINHYGDEVMKVYNI
jgi:hypothetical protein